MSEDDLDELKRLRIETEAFNAAWKWLTDENAALRKALQPFAALSAAYETHGRFIDARPDTVWYAFNDIDITLAHLHAANKALRGGQS